MLFYTHTAGFFLIVAQHVKSIALSCLFTAASVILQLSCNLGCLQSDGMIPEQKDVPKTILELCSEG